MIENIYYIYIWLDPRKPGKYIYGDYKFDHEPIYVGAGKNKRFKLFFDSNARHYSVLAEIKKIKQLTNKNPISIILINGLSQEESFLKEQEIILLIGKKYNNTGPLLNIADGGRGSKGFHHPEEVKKNKISKPGNLNPFYGKTHSKENIQKMSKPRIKRDKFGHPCSEETKEKLRLFNLGKRRTK